MLTRSLRAAVVPAGALAAFFSLTDVFQPRLEAG